jgi:hypothetical protein
MKTLIKKFGLPIAVGIVLSIITLIGLASTTFTSCKKVKHCQDASSPYYCESANKCCAYQYTDGHGTCYSTYSGCISSGYSCETCYVE